MSRLGKTPIQLPKGVDIKLEGQTLKVTGPKGTLTQEVAKGISFKVEEGFAHVIKDEAVEMPKPTQGLFRALLNNMVIGVTKGFEIRLALIGVGYRATLQGNKLDLQLGLSHPLQLLIPKNIAVSVDKNVTIIITGADKQAVGQFAATVRSKKPPEPYKGKGIRYENEFVRKKAGKAAKSKTA